MPYIDPRELNDLALLASRGGLGRGTATSDCVAEAPDQLMFITGDVLILLRELEEVVLASCEGVVGWVQKGLVEFDRVSSSSTSSHTSSHHSTPKTSLDSGKRDLPRTILTAPSPPPRRPSLPGESLRRSSLSNEYARRPSLPGVNGEVKSALSAPRESKRISSPFEFESPQQSPSLEQSEKRFSMKQTIPAIVEEDDDKRGSILSVASSEMWGGIGGFMMGGDMSMDDNDEELLSPEGTLGEVSPATEDLKTPFEKSTHEPSPLVAESTSSHATEDDLETPPNDPNESFDDEMVGGIYDQYARESMYVAKRMSQAARRASKMPRGGPNRESEAAFSALQAVNAARAALERGNSPTNERTPSGSRKNSAGEGNDLDTPRRLGRTPLTSPIVGGAMAQSLATQLRLKIQQEREAESAEPPISPKSTRVSSAFRSDEAVASSEPSSAIDSVRQILSIRTSTTDQEMEGSVESPVDPNGFEGDLPRSASDNLESDESMGTEAHTPIAQEVSVLGPSIVTGDESLDAQNPPEYMSTILPSDLEVPPKEERVLALEAPADILPPEAMEHSDPVPDALSPIMSPPNLVPRPPRTHSPNPLNRLLHDPWSPESPASPHSIDATRQIVEAVRATPEGGRPRAVTLVGRTDSDLTAARGPVPITFLIGGSDANSASTSIQQGLGLGLPGRPPVTPEQRGRPFMSVSAPPPPMPDDISTIRSVPSRFPQPPARSLTTPISYENLKEPEDTSAGPRPGFFAARPRSRSFGAAMAKAVGRMKKDTPPSIMTDKIPNVPTIKAPDSRDTAVAPRKNSLPERKGSFATSPSDYTSLGSPATATAMITQTSLPIVTSSKSGIDPTTPSASVPSNRSASFSFSKIKTPRKPSRTLPSPVSHKDFEDTINASGTDFELVRPNKPLPLSPTSTNTLGVSSPGSPGAPKSPAEDGDKATLASLSSTLSLNSRAALPDTDEWGFIKDKMVTPEIFQSRSAPGEHRTAETRWLAVISTPLPSGGAPRKIRKFVHEAGIPASLRGKVWAWFLSRQFVRKPGMYEELSKKDKSSGSDDELERDIARLWSDHQLFFSATSPGRSDLISILRAYSNSDSIKISEPLIHVAGTLLIHSVAEDAFWLLSGMMNSFLKTYFDDPMNLAIDMRVFEVVMRGSEKELSGLFKQTGVKSSDYLERWYRQLFIRCLPWPTALRVIDVLVSEGPRFLLIAALTTLTLSQQRLLALPKTRQAILDYLHDLPQDSLLLPENFLRQTQKVKFTEEDWTTWRASEAKSLHSGK